MSENCVGCSCDSVSVGGAGSLVLFASRVNHTVVALRALALRSRATVRELAPGLLELETEATGELIDGACRALSTVAQAMTAPSLAEAGARVKYADLVELFEDEARCFHSEYQRIVDLADGKVFGHEALLRAETPSGTRVMPDDLFPAAHAVGWTHLLDRVGRTTALRDAGSWLGTTCCPSISSPPPSTVPRSVSGPRSPPLDKPESDSTSWSSKSLRGIGSRMCPILKRSSTTTDPRTARLRSTTWVQGTRR
jgi:hypothetical protein